MLRDFVKTGISVQSPVTRSFDPVPSQTTAPETNVCGVSHPNSGIWLSRDIGESEQDSLPGFSPVPEVRGFLGASASGADCCGMAALVKELAPAWLEEYAELHANSKAISREDHEHTRTPFEDIESRTLPGPARN